MTLILTTWLEFAHAQMSTSTIWQSTQLFTDIPGSCTSQSINDNRHPKKIMLKYKNLVAKFGSMQLLLDPLVIK